MNSSYKLIVLAIAGLIVACSNNKDTSTADKKENSSTNSAKALPADSMTKEALFSFVDGCVTNAKITLGEEKAFGFCKCIYEQIRKENPDVDSTKLSALVNDTAQLTRMAATCR